VGKTHLLYAIANAVTRKFPEKNVVYVKGEQFTTELVQSILTSSTMDFKKKYRQADVLLVDDIQSIAGKESTQEEFFNTFNELYERGKQIVITSDRKPSDMSTLEDRLKGRFGAGVMVEIAQPNEDTRLMIVRDKAQKLGLSLDEPAVAYISDKPRDNVRQIEGGLRKIRAFRDLSGMTLTADNITGIGKITNNGTIVKTGAESISLPFDNASTGMTVINAGQVNVKSVTGSGSAQTIVVKSGATFDMNGYAVTTASMRLEDGATLKDDRKNIRNDMHQTTNLILDGDATVNAVKFFGLCGSSDSAATTLNIGEHTLTVEGSGFWLVNTTIEGGGEIVANGVLSVPMGSSSGADCTLTIASGGTLHGNGTLSVKNFTNNGTINNTAMLTVTGTLTPANEIPRLTLASGATVKATGTTQTVSTTFSASGTITVDASEITKAQLDAGDVPVLTVPATFNHSGVTWNVTGAAIEGARAKWRTDEGGATKTLYVGKSTGLMLIFM
jgi:hypothetical protein